VTAARRLRVLAVVCVAALGLPVGGGVAPVAALPCAPAAGFAQTLDCEIAAAGEVDAFSFDGVAGDRVLAWAIRTCDAGGRRADRRHGDVRADGGGAGR
jgi:hypothetical protein